MTGSGARTVVLIATLIAGTTPLLGGHILSIGQTVTYDNGAGLVTSYTFLGYVTDAQNNIDACEAEQPGCILNTVGFGGVGTAGPSSYNEATLGELFGIDANQMFVSTVNSGVRGALPSHSGNRGWVPRSRDRFGSHSEFAVHRGADGGHTTSTITYGGSGSVRYIVVETDGWWALFELQNPLDTPGEMAYITDENMPFSSGITRLSFLTTPEPSAFGLLLIGLLGIGLHVAHTLRNGAPPAR